MTPADTSVIIVTHDSAALVPSVLDALAGDRDGPAEVIVVDSASSDDTLELLAGYDVTVISEPDNIGFAAACHVGALAARGEAVVFLGHDTVPRSGWLGPLVTALEDPDIGAAMATIEDASDPGTFNTSGGVIIRSGKNKTTKE